jgi:peptide-methionine (S)-S-oxide reductase
MFFLKRDKSKMPDVTDALPGRDASMPVPERHFILDAPLKPPFPAGIELAQFGLGCFWGAERKFWETDGIYSTSVGYGAGTTKNPTYEEVCSGQTGHNELVLVAFNPKDISYDALLRVFWENHNPTQGMRQGNDMGTQYRSGIYTYSPEQQAQALASKDAYEANLHTSGFGDITTEVTPASEFYFAEDYHQQYLAKNPSGYCGIGGTGVAWPIGLNV